MTKTMLIDSANPEEIRVCLLQNGKVEDFDFESASRKPVRGNIYLAKVTRVEPSLQAAFVEFGGNRHGFLAFSEIHPDYYQIPISDRRLIQEAEAEEAAIAAALNINNHGDDDLEDIDAELSKEEGAHHEGAVGHEDRDADEHGGSAEPDAEPFESAPLETSASEPIASDEADDEEIGDLVVSPLEIETIDVEAAPDAASEEEPAEEDADADEEEDEDDRPRKPVDEALAKLSRPQLIERYKEARRKRARLLRNYKIQEVIKRRQILLVQAVKEERGNKGAALTTYLSLAGRYCVLMPNTARGGGISRKIPVAADRKRLRRVVDGLDVPTGMGLIIRTAGAKRTKAEIKRDYDYLIRLWENIRNLTLKSIAPCLIYEEASLIKRAIRDLYDKDIGAVLVEGDNGYREAKDFMKMLMPSHSKNVQPYKEKTPLFLHYGVEPQLDAMYQPTVRLKSGGYIVINQTEALIAIDVNSGKSTRERNIEQTALRTNLEAADEAARQCRLRDLAGLIVIDFIDMEEGRNNRAVEKRLKDALRADRARIQLGRISGFGLLEMSRQRRRSGIVDGTTHMCPTCGGAGAVRSHEMAALRILRSAEVEAISSKAGNLQIKAALDVTLYILNHKREWLRRIETDYGVSVELTADPAKAGDNFEIEKTGVRSEIDAAPVVVRADTTETIEPDVEEDEDVAVDEHESETERADQSGEERGGRRRRRRRRRGGREGASADAPRHGESGDESDVGSGDMQPAVDPEGEQPSIEASESDDDKPRKRRRRGRRGGRRGRRPDEAGDSNQEQSRVDAEISDAGNGADGSDDDESLAVETEYDGKTTADAPAQDFEAPVEQAAHADEDAFLEPEPEQPVVVTQQEATLEPETTVQQDAEPAKPARKGWWNRALGG